jgi:hypothetical protein
MAVFLSTLLSDSRGFYKQRFNDRSRKRADSQVKYWRVVIEKKSDFCFKINHRTVQY